MNTEYALDRRPQKKDRAGVPVRSKIKRWEEDNA